MVDVMNLSRTLREGPRRLVVDTPGDTREAKVVLVVDHEPLPVGVDGER